MDLKKFPNQEKSAIIYSEVTVYETYLSFANPLLPKGHISIDTADLPVLSDLLPLWDGGNQPLRCY